MPALDHFSLVAPFYDRIFQLPDIDLLLSHVAPAPHHKLLDVGGGTGRVAQHFVGHVAQVCILDPNPHMLLQGQRKGICITRGQAEELPFASHTFDRVIMVDAFHHLRDQELALRDLLRVLKPGGRLVIEEPDIRRRAVQLVAVGEKLLLMRSQFRSARELVAMVERAGGQAQVEGQGHTIWAIAHR